MLSKPLFILCILSAFSLSNEANAANYFTNQSRKWPLSVKSADPTQSQMILNDTEKTLEYMVKIFGPSMMEDLSLVWIWDVKDQEQVADHLFPRSVYLQDNYLFEIEGWNHPRSSQEQIVRTTALCMLQALWLKNQEQKKPANEILLPTPPFWLLEGLVFGVIGKQVDLYQKVIRRFEAMNLTPSLQDVQGWEKTSDHFLEQYQQKIYCRRLVIAATSNEPERKALKMWLIRNMARKDRLYWVESQPNNSWWNQVLNKAEPKKVPIMSWEETASQLSGLLNIPVFVVKERRTRLVSIKELPHDVEDNFREREEFQQIIEQLKYLEIMGDPSWSKIIEAYRFAIKAWLLKRPKDYQECIDWAAELEGNLASYKAEVSDLLDWAEVNFSVVPLEADYLSYNEIKREFERLRETSSDLYDQGFTKVKTR